MRHLFFAFLMGAGLLPVGGWAQEFRSTLTGQVADSQGAAMPGVKIVAKLGTTGAEFTTVSATTGQYPAFSAAGSLFSHCGRSRLPALCQ